MTSFTKVKDHLASLACLRRRLLLFAAPPVFASCLFAQSPEKIGELFASETTAHGPVLLAGTGMEVASGSQLTAGNSVATLRLARGGEVRICPNAALTVSTAQNNPAPPGTERELMMAMDVGSLELDYPINDLADTLITPDFKFMLPGPGVFHFALGVNDHGDTCIKPLRGNSASVIVAEMAGTGVYQVKPGEALMFNGGKLSGREPLVGSCGCPAPLPVLQANANPEPTTQPEHPEISANAVAPAAPDQAPPETSNPPLRPAVQTPLVFRGDQPKLPVLAPAKVRFSTLPNVFLTQENKKPIVLKPGKGEVSKKKGFFGRIKGFFAALFHK
jgi:hypothetical protein